MINIITERINLVNKFYLRCTVRYADLDDGLATLYGKVQLLREEQIFHIEKETTKNTIFHFIY